MGTPRGSASASASASTGLGQSMPRTARARVEPAPAQKMEVVDEGSRVSAVYASDWDRYFLSPTSGGRCFMWMPIIGLPFTCWYYLIRPCFFTQPAKTHADGDVEEGRVSGSSASYAAAESP